MKTAQPATRARSARRANLGSCLMRVITRVIALARKIVIARNGTLATAIWNNATADRAKKDVQFVFQEASAYSAQKIILIVQQQLMVRAPRPVRISRLGTTAKMVWYRFVTKIQRPLACVGRVKIAQHVQISLQNVVPAFLILRWICLGSARNVYLGTRKSAICVYHIKERILTENQVLRLQKLLLGAVYQLLQQFAAGFRTTQFRRNERRQKLYEVLAACQCKIIAGGDSFQIQRQAA
uniref:Uncharacterized protein n=1 Tax=Spironucleus salmonicida TaxID=348837 RepID=V6LPY3_9EUKA|eukprot:EST46727.1 Hypothetical protein SS50377_13242 [Spironucleus salmonicida]